MSTIKVKTDKTVNNTRKIQRLRSNFYAYLYIPLTFPYFTSFAVSTITLLTKLTY